VSPYKQFRFFIFACLLPAGMSLPALAQNQAPPSTSFEELRAKLRVRPDENVQITDQTGAKFNARITEIRDQAIAITVNGQRRELSESSVSEIRQRRPDRWWNGMLIGLGAGALTGALITANTCKNDSECRFYMGLVAIPLSAGIGAGAGAAIDFGIKKYDTVYSRPGIPVRSGLSISPILSKDEKGIGVSFAF
jgi:hypothetical protein